MYLWKCWRDTRYPFLVFVSALLAWGAYGAYVQFDPFGWVAAKPEASRVIWQGMARFGVASMVGFIPLVGFVLGSLGVGTEFEKRTADFLLTRPHTRRYFLWTSWSVGAAQIIALVLLSHAINRLTGTDYLNFGQSVDILSNMAAFSTIALVIYTVTFVMTTLTRKSQHGMSLGVAVIVAYTGLYGWVLVSYGTRIPMIWERIFYSGRAISDLAPSVIFGWLIVCFVLVLAAQFSLERAET